ncbi:MAG: HupE/UreJ family protein [Gammaproteobacteria bacterium]
MLARLWLLAFSLALPVGAAHAHEFRTAYLEVTQTEAQRYALAWQLGAAEAARSELRLVAAPGCQLEPTARDQRERMMLERYQLDCGAASAAWLQIDGIASSMTDALVKLIEPDGAERFEHLHSGRTRLALDEEPASVQPRANLFAEGVVHVLGGADHLTYVFLLFIFLRKRWRTLLLGVTAFTLAHSASLTLAMTGWIALAPAPVEAVIALTIAHFALVIAKGGSSIDIVRARWLAVIFLCGLVHGLGFANSLSAIGLDRADLAWGLVSFNLGIEAGQVAFICVLAALAQLARSLLPSLDPAAAARAAAIVPGALGIFWYLQRVAS